MAYLYVTLVLYGTNNISGHIQYNQLVAMEMGTKTDTCIHQEILIHLIKMSD